MLNKEPEQFREMLHTRTLWKKFQQDKVALISFYLFVFLLILVFLGNVLAPYNIEQQFIGLELLPPSWETSGRISHFFGTDDLGRDVFSRVLSGFYVTVGSSLVVSFAVVLVGSIIGVYAGLNKGTSGSFLSHLFDTFLFIPAMLISIIIATLMDASLVNAMFAIFLALLPHFIHHIYQEVQQELQREYVITLKLDGIDKKTLIKEVIFPNLSVSAIKEITKYFAFIILDISALSFIALGAKSGSTEWGTMIRDSAELIYIAPWTVVLPGLAITFSIFIVTMLGNSIVRVLAKYRQ